MNCEKCNNCHNGSYGSGRFCSRQCANSRVFTKETNVLRSIKYKKYWEFLPEIEKKKAIDRLGLYNSNRKIITADIPFEKRSFEGKRSIIIKEQNNKCNKCGIDSWQNAPISLEIDHKDGNRLNDKKENLEGLCPNCHSQTSTYRGKNKKQDVPRTDDEIIAAIYLHPTSIRQVLLHLGLAPKGKNYTRVKEIIYTNKLTVYTGYSKI